MLIPEIFFLEAFFFLIYMEICNVKTGYPVSSINIIV